MTWVLWAYILHWQVGEVSSKDAQEIISQLDLRRKLAAKAVRCIPVSVSSYQLRASIVQAGMTSWEPQGYTEFTLDGVTGPG